MKFQTYKGMISEKTTMEELKSIFYRTDSWTTARHEETQLFIIPDEMESDDQ